jgi:ATP-binding cassette subfamily B protein RaxB
LFQGSVADNISGFEAAPDAGRIREAAQIAQIWEEIAARPMKMHTPITSTTAGFSGGQVQRILLARALYRQPRILFLDEATSHLDPCTERRVLDGLDRLRLTTICVAHRDAVLERANRLIRL